MQIVPWPVWSSWLTSVWLGTAQVLSEALWLEEELILCSKIRS